MEQKLDTTLFTRDTYDYIDRKKLTYLIRALDFSRFGMRVNTGF
jgi:hypothetical protein